MPACDYNIAVRCVQMVILYKDPKGEKIFERTQSVSQTGNYEVDVDNLEKHCRDLENRLGRYEVSMSFFGKMIKLLIIYLACTTHNCRPVINGMFVQTNNYPYLSQN